jgi:hypothetical protein
MKRTIMSLAMVFGFVGSLSASDIWEHYRVISDNAKSGLRALESASPESLSITSADALVKQYEEVGHTARQLGREDLYVWTLNNAGYARIVLFKKLVRYDFANAAINSLSPKNKERTVLVRALQIEYIKYKSLLEEALDALTKAVQDGQYVENNTTQWDRIVSNREFAVHSLGFMEEKF